MKLNLITRALIMTSVFAVSYPVLALEEWNGQEGSDKFEVLFNSKVYQNAWWVGSNHCPGNADKEADTNPWRVMRSATSSEINQYGNPTDCSANGGGNNAVSPDFNLQNTYQKGDVVSVSNVTYEAQRNIPAYSFAPGEKNPWQLYKATQTWQSAQTYLAGDEVKVGDQAYRALFWTQGQNPSDPQYQNPNSNNGQPWQPLGRVNDYTQTQLNNAPELNTQQRYQKNTLVKYQNQPYVSQREVQSTKPDETNPWRVFTDWGTTKQKVGTPQKAWPKHVYAPYVDFTLNSIPNLAELAKNNQITHYTLAFIVAKNANTCLPTWGTAYGMANYSQYSKIKALRDIGGDVMVSIGGANNAPLAASCNNIDDLAQHYYEIVDNLNLNMLDFDIEGNWVADQASIERRNLAVKKVQDRWAKEGKNIGIWYTLPILPTGLTHEGLNVLNDAKAKGVKLSGINVMTMDYGNSICQSTGTEGQNIHANCAVSAVDNLANQIKSIWTNLSTAEAYALIGTTPMIGMNDVQGETFYLSDARKVYEHAKQRDLGMIGIWSIARDKAGTIGQVSPEHSGLQIRPYEFSGIFSPFTQQGGAVVPPPVNNHAPVANAGNDQTVNGNATITLDGSQSYDEDGDTLTYRWTQISGPTVTLSNSTQARATFKHQGNENAIYQFKLEVSDGKLTSSATTKISVMHENQPVAPQVTVPNSYRANANEIVTLTATVSDPDSRDDQISWQWTVPSGLTIVSGQNSRTLMVKAPANNQEKRYSLQVKATDQTNLSDTQSTTLIVAASVITPPPSGDYEYVYPNGIARYTAGTKVKGADGKIYQCKPFPYAGWCGQAAWAYEPGRGTAWDQAWKRL